MISTIPSGLQRRDHSIHFARKISALGPESPLDLAVEAALMRIEQATEGKVRVDLSVINVQTVPGRDISRVGHPSDCREDDALCLYTSVQGKGGWYHFHHVVRVLSGCDSVAQLYEMLVAPTQMALNSLGAAFEQASSAPKPEPSPPPAKKTPPPPSPPPKPEVEDSTPPAKKPREPKLPKPKGRVGRSPKAAAELPVNLDNQEDRLLLAIAMRDRGLGKGEWVSDDVLRASITDAICSLYTCESGVPEEWVRACRNRLSGEDVLHAHSEGDAAYWQLVLENEEPVPFGQAPPPANAEAEPETVPEPEPQPEPEPPQPPPEEVPPAEPEPPPAPVEPPPPTPAPAASSPARKLTALDRVVEAHEVLRQALEEGDAIVLEMRALSDRYEAIQARARAAHAEVDAFFRRLGG